MSSQIALEEYELALKKGQKEYRELVMAGKPAYPAVLDEVLESVSADTTQEVGLLEIPAERIIGVKSKGRITAFTRNFLPLLDRDSEFRSRSGRKFRVKAVMRPLDLTPTIRSAGISTRPTSCTMSEGFSCRISSRTCG